MEDFTDLDEASVTNAIQDDEDKRKTSTTSIDLKPTTMRGIPLASLIQSPIPRGFYITKSKNDTPLSTLVDISAQPCSTINIFIQKQTKSTSISDASMAETLTASNNQIKPEPNDNVVNEKNVDKQEEKSSTPSSPVISSTDSSDVENLPIYEKSNLVTVPIDKSIFKKEKLYNSLDHTTPTSNSRIMSSTTPTRRKIAVVIRRYNEATTPLWTGKRIVAKRRNRTTLSPIKDAIRRTESDFIHSPTSTLRSASSTASASISRRRKLLRTSTTPMSSSAISDSAESSETLNNHNNFVNSTDATTENPETTTEVTTSTNFAEASSISKIIPAIDSPIDVSTFSDDRTMLPAVTDKSTITLSLDEGAKTSSIITDATVETTVDATSVIKDETVSPNYSDNPIIDSPFPTSFATHAETEVTSVNIVPETTIVINYVTEPTVANTEMEAAFTTNYSTIAIPDVADAQEIAIDPATTSQIINANMDTTFAIANYSATATPTTTSMRDTTSTASIADVEVDTTSTVEDYSTFTMNTNTIPASLPLATVVSSTDTAQYTDLTTTTNAQAEENITTPNAISTMSLNEVIPIIDLDVTTISTTENISSSINENSPTTIQSKTDSMTSLQIPIVTLTESAASLTTEYSTTHLNNLDINNNSEISTEKRIKTIEIPMTFETSSILTSTSTAYSNFYNTSSELPILATTFSDPENKNSSTLEMTQNPLNLSSMLVNNKTAATLETSPMSSAIFDESITTNPTNIYSTGRIQTISKELTSKINLKEATRKIQNQIEDKIIRTINKVNSPRITNDQSATPRIKISKETTSKIIETRKQNQTTSEFDRTNYYYNQKTARRRVLNRTNNWLGSPLNVLQNTNQYPRHRVQSYRGQSRRAPSYVSSSRRNERNRRRRIRFISAAFNDTRLDQSPTQNISENHIVNDRVENLTKVKELKKTKNETIEKEASIILSTEETMSLFQSLTAIKNKTLQVHENKQIEEKRNVTLTGTSEEPEEKLMAKEIVHSNFTNKNLSGNFQNNVTEDFSEAEKSKKIMETVLKNEKSEFKEKNPIEETNIDSDFINTDQQSNFSKNVYTNIDPSNKRITRRRMRVVLKSVRPKSEKNSTIEETSEKFDSTDKNLRYNLLNNSVSQNNQKRTRRRMRIVLKSVKPITEKKNSTLEERIALNSTNENSTEENNQNAIPNNFHSDENFLTQSGTKKEMRVVLKSVKLKENSTIEETNVSLNQNVQNTLLNDSHINNNLKHGNKRRMRVVLKSIKPIFEEKNLTNEETNVHSDFADENLQSSFSSNFHTNKNFFEQKEARKRRAIKKRALSVEPKLMESNSVAEETNLDLDFTKKVPKILHIFNFSSNAVNDGLPDEKKKRSKSEEKETTTEQLEDMEAQTMRTSVPEKDTDQPSLEVANNRSTSRNSENGFSNRHRKPTSFTTIAPSTNTLSNTLTIHRRRRPVETTLSSRIDYIDAFEDTESKPAITLHDQNVDVSDQNTRAQEFAVTLSDPPTSSSNIGRTTLKDPDRRKISTTIAPRTVPRYDANFRSRQKPRTKDRPTVNATTRPRRPPIIDYDYYEDETPIVIDKSLLNSKLFLTSKGTIRCLDQGNFPHPYSCKKFITCARMVNGQVFGTEYTCPDKLSFDPIGGICNWSAGLGCKD